MNPPCVIFEDDDLLVIDKPAGINTHSPSPYAGEGIYEWLRDREPRWRQLAIIHRLDKETSGVLLFAKTEAGRRSLTKQFERRSVRKVYLLESSGTIRSATLKVESAVVRTGERYAARPPHAGAVLAETRFRRISSSGAVTRIEAEPVTGRTHQVRVHAAHSGFPILGDTLYGGRPSDRVHLHCRKLTLEHPTTGKPIAFEAPVDFTSDSRLGLRQALLPTKDTDAYRLIHSASDGWPGWYVDRLGECLLSQSDRDISNPQLKTLERWRREFGSRSAYHKILSREVGRTSANESSPQRIFGEAMADGPVVMENGIRFSLSMDAGYSVGLFLDQRDNRRRFLTNHVAADFTLFDNPSRVELLNTFAYTCGFSICAAKAGARTTSVDLSRKYLEWGKRNFKLNDIDPASHDFMYGDVFDWLKRLARKGRQFDAVVLDPPTFSRSKEHGDFRAEKDYGQLVKASLPLLKSGGVLFASTNAARLSSEASLKTITESIIDSRRRITAQHYAPQPPDFPISREEPAYLKTVWIRVS